MANIIDRTGEVSYNNFGSKIVIKEYRNYDDIDVYFPKYNYTKEHAQYDKFKKGKVRCPYEPRVFGVGYLGEGRHMSSINRKHTKHYNLWNSMLQRCYDPKFIEKYPTYTGCKVCPEWHNFQVFSEWVEKNYYEIEGDRMALDKDILCKGNKIYSPKNCIFVPNRINSLFVKCDNSRGDLPIGVSYTNKKYRAYYHTDKATQHLGCYNTPEEAFQAYKTFKENYIKGVAEEYKNVIPQKLYEAMLRYEVDIDD